MKTKKPTIQERIAKSLERIADILEIQNKPINIGITATEVPKLQSKSDFWEVTDDGKLKTSEIVAKLRKKFPVYIYSEKDIDNNFPIPALPTTRYFKKNIEADEELKNLSAKDLEEKGIKGITLQERLLLELQYFNETANHLDINNITLCSGSRALDGGVPFVYWGGGRMGVRWCIAGYRHDGVRSRAAVSF